MTDLSSLSDDQLKAMYHAPAAAASAPDDLSKMSDDELKAAYDNHPSVMADVAKSGGVGLAKGAIGLAGSVGDLSDLGAKGLEHASNYISDKLGIERYKRPDAPSVLNNIPTSASLTKNIEDAAGSKLYSPKTTAGGYAETAGEFVPAVLGGGEGLLSKLATRVAAPAIASETAGQISKGSEAEPYARFAGALMSPAMLAIGRRAVTPLPASAERTNLANTLRGEGVDLTAGQATGNKPLQWAESVLGDMPFAGGRPAQTMQRQGEQFTGAALRRVGENAERATPEVINNAFDRIGNQFETIGARNHVAPDAQFVQDLRIARDEYHNLVGPHARAPVVDNTITDIVDQMRRNGGVLNGDQYNAMTSRLGRQARAAKADPQLQSTLQGLKESLDDAFERTLQRTGNAADHAALREARNQYRNLMVVEKAATGAGSANAEGLISPSGLRNAVVQQNRRSYARGRGDFADLARSGEALLKPLPNSGTAPRQNLQHVLTILGGTAGGAAGGFPGIAAGIAAPAAGGRVLMSRPVQAYLGNQVALPGAREALPTSLSRALVASKASQEALSRDRRDGSNR